MPFIISEIIFDKMFKRGKDSDIRLAYIGYWKRHKDIDSQDRFCKIITILTKKKVTISWYKPNIIISSVFDKYLFFRLVLAFSRAPVLFFSGENLSLKKFSKYRNYTGEIIKLRLGFDDNPPHSYRFPLWLFKIFTSEFIARSSLEDIQVSIEEIERKHLLDKKYFAAMISKHDGIGPVSRMEIVKLLNKIDLVSCAGRYLHNDESLFKEFKNDKKKYLEGFLFNICPENSSTPGYVTEKLFQSFDSGCIPIYWGDSNPEYNILNAKRIIFWREGPDNRKNLELIEKLYISKKERDIFFQENIFVKGADRAIYDYFLMIRAEILKLL
jgi:alpha(1,3/1,4) fucosyltransferase